jgi:tape measure domain-containing protein
MAENVGSIEYIASIDLKEFVRNQREIDTRLGNLEKSGDKLESAMTKVAAAVKLVAAAYAAVQLVKIADEMRLLGARVNVVAGSVEEGNKAWNQLVAISARTQSAVADNVSLFTRLNSAIKELGGTQQDTLRFTELVTKAIKVSGATTAEASAAQLQFAQALGSGKLAGDELKSLMESSPYLMRQLADSLGVPIGALKQLGADGELTADKVVTALSKAAKQINSDFEQLPKTFEGAMTVARDAAARAALGFDQLAGSSTLLSGTVKGVGDTLDQLAIQFNNAAHSAKALGDDKSVRTWAEDVRTGLSYVVDAADVAWQTLSVLGRNVAFVFKGIGTEIGGIAAQAAAVARGDFAGAAAIGDAMKAEAEQRRRELDEADQKTLSRARTLGQQMRQAWEAPQASYSNEGRNAARSSTFKPVSTEEKAKKSTFDADAYLSSLRQASLKGLELIDERQSAELEKNEKLFASKKLTLLQYTQAEQEILAKAQADRDKFYEQDQDAALHAAEVKRQAIEEQGRLAAEAAKAAAEDAKKNDPQALIDKTLGKGEDPVSKLLAENTAKLELIKTYEEQRYLTEEQASALRVALMKQEQEQLAVIEQQRQQQQAAVMSMQLQNYSSLFGAMGELTKTFAGEQSGAYKAMFAVSKAFAIADSIVKIQQGIANAMSLPWPANLAAAASTAAAAAGIVGTIQSTNFGGGRQYGGPASAGSMYRVNEKGRPEMFTAASGEQYMLPTKSGQVTAADKVGGGGQAWKINVINNAGGSTATASVDDRERTVTIAINEIANQIASNSGPVWGAMRGSTNVQGRF